MTTLRNLIRRNERMETLSAKKTYSHTRILSAINSQMMRLRFKILFFSNGRILPHYQHQWLSVIVGAKMSSHLCGYDCSMM